MYVYVSVYVHMCLCVHVYTDAFVCLCVHTCMYVRMHGCVCAATPDHNMDCYMRSLIVWGSPRLVTRSNK